MSIYRSYFSKNNTLVTSGETNNSQNPVTEISYGTYYSNIYGSNIPEVSRFIFDVDLDNISDRINSGLISVNNIVSHTLHMTNTISYAEKYIGRKSYDSGIQRASSFDLDLFNINQNWDEGSGYDLNFSNIIVSSPVNQASNWYSAQTNSLWNTEGLYNSGGTQIIGTQHFDKGNENISIDVTNYINQRLTGGTLSYTGTSYGLGLKFQDIYESLTPEDRQTVAFHTKNTNTWYEPYIETVISDTIADDRNYFFLDKYNSLYLYVSRGNVTVNKVEIYNQAGNVHTTFSGDSISYIGDGIYKIQLKISSISQVDAVMFTDKWYLTLNGSETTFENSFYLISNEKYYDFDNNNNINLENYYFYYWGISQNEKLKAGDIRKIEVTIKELYPNHDNNLPLDVEYRLYTTIGDKYEIDVIPYTSVNRTNKGFYFNLDTSWLIPQDYFIQIRLKNGNYYQEKQKIAFTIVSDAIILV
jgi:hypothetical protein